VRLKVLASLSAAGGSALAALWSFPTLLASAFLVAWAAEAARGEARTSQSQRGMADFLS